MPDIYELAKELYELEIEYNRLNRDVNLSIVDTIELSMKLSERIDELLKIPGIRKAYREYSLEIYEEKHRQK